MNNELYHYGVLGMKWGVQRKRSGSKNSSRELRKLDRKLNKYNYGPNQNKVLSERNKALIGDRTAANKWRSAAKAGKGTKEWIEWERYQKEINKKFQGQYIDAWIRDNDVKRLSEKGRKYLEDKIGFR